MSFDAYLRAKQAGQQEGLNALALEQAGQEMRRDRRLRNIMAESYTPGAPTVTNALQEGPIRPGLTQVYPDRPGAVDREKMLGLMYQGGFGPEAMQMEQAASARRLKTGGGIGTYNPRDYTPESWAQFVDTRDPGILKRYTEKTVNIGGVEHLFVPDKGFVPLSTLEAEAGAKATIAGTKAEAVIESKALAGEKTVLADMEAALPALKDVAAKLSRLGKVATFTKAGQAVDYAARQAGQSTKGAVARADYIATVANEILPLLRQTFGAAFTAQEGESLKATLGDPDSSPAEKDAQLKAFIESKERQIRSGRRRVGEASAGETMSPAGNAPQSAIDYLTRNNTPAVQAQFKAKYGYLP